MIRSIHQYSRHIGAVFVAVLLGSIVAMSASADVTPPTVDATLEPGAGITVSKVVETPDVLPDPEIVFLADSTGSMGSFITGVKAAAGTILSEIATAQPSAKFGVADYKDIYDIYLLNVGQTLTSSQALAQTAINNWSWGGGGDWPEGQVPALHQLATGAAGTWGSGTSRIIVWFGDAPEHSPRAGVTVADAIAALNAANVRVVAVDVSSLDAYGGATAITSGTGGVLAPYDGGAVADVILDSIGAIPITVVPVVSTGCELEIEFTPASVTVISGEDAEFSEAITVPGGTLPGEYSCTVDFTSDDASLGVQTITISVPGSNAPPDCDSAAPSVGLIWPPNHKMVSVDVLGVTDPDDDPISITIDGITQDEPVNDQGDGSFAPDGDGVGTSTAEVRAERQGTKGKNGSNGRVYEISFTADDGNGGTCSGSINVGVPHDKKKGNDPVDDGYAYDSTDS